MGSTSDGIVQVTVKVGFLDRQDMPQEHPFRSWPQRLFLALERNQADRTEVFHLPPTRTVVMGSELET